MLKSQTQKNLKTTSFPWVTIKSYIYSWNKIDLLSLPIQCENHDRLSQHSSRTFPISSFRILLILLNRVLKQITTLLGTAYDILTLKNVTRSNRITIKRITITHFITTIPKFLIRLKIYVYFTPRFAATICSLLSPSNPAIDPSSLYNIMLRSLYPLNATEVEP